MKKKIDGHLVRFTFSDDTPELVFDTTKVSAENRAYAVPFAFSHRLGDSAATCKTEAERRAAIAQLAAHYESGSADWNVRGSGIAPQNPVILAIAAKLGITYEEAQAKLVADFLE